MSPRHPLYQLTRSRLLEFAREPEAIFWVFVFPVLLALGLGIAFRNRPAEALPVAVQNGPGSAALARTLDAAPELRASTLPSDEARNRLRTGKLALVVVPGEPTTYLFDPTRSDGRLARLLADNALQRAAGRDDPVPVLERRLEEPGSRYIDFLIPGLIGLNMMGAGMWGVGFTIVQFRRKRLLKRLLATPMRRSHFLLSFAFSRLIFMIAELAALVGFGWVVFDVRVHGSILSLLVVAVIGSLSFAGLGLLSASRARTIEGVSGIMNLVQLPMWIFSGVFFAYQQFPEVMHPYIKALPLTALNDAIRAVMTDGTSILGSIPELAIVAAWGIVSFGTALNLFRWS
ncbi:MAG: ABC transporter permease [Gemmatimonadetes bacterium]|uniref:ABC transporter permease n=1 Tax=Candidatus Kutchimonas denitrificans TaxID=3056748 RepID=A0AAE4Z619_9BACT|nr:ABC transporter permease [Gemmatimonadota bacterium]NIR73693.1 ABC transporter permease [Candidatus Kutchimonas denitrificans]NIS00743.1 ABC transporter permease [Gemmatimonadota bacterium]NIT66330.1 ABC transporter permease [Gemmatimonadota bacterium]NIU51548.1 ABC transporter permease [Gemmatimonadota bacterium]